MCTCEISKAQWHGGLGKSTRKDLSDSSGRKLSLSCRVRAITVAGIVYVQGAACPMDMVTGDGLLKASLPTDRKAIKPPMAATERMMMKVP